MKLCFDSSVWNALINLEVNKDLDSIRAHLQGIEKGTHKLLVPVVVAAEVYAHADPTKVDLFERLCLRTSIELIDLTAPAAKTAGQLRRHAKDSLQVSIKTPDALIIASADLNRCDQLHSFDTGILRCDGKFGLKVRICRPEEGFDQPLFMGNAQ